MHTICIFVFDSSLLAMISVETDGAAEAGYNITEKRHRQERERDERPERGDGLVPVIFIPQKQRKDHYGCDQRNVSGRHSFCDGIILFHVTCSLSIRSSFQGYPRYHASTV